VRLLIRAVPEKRLPTNRKESAAPPRACVAARIGRRNKARHGAVPPRISRKILPVIRKRSSPDISSQTASPARAPCARSTHSPMSFCSVAVRSGPFRKGRPPRPGQRFTAVSMAVRAMRGLIGMAPSRRSPSEESGPCRLVVTRNRIGRGQANCKIPRRHRKYDSAQEYPAGTGMASSPTGVTGKGARHQAQCQSQQASGSKRRCRRQHRRGDGVKQELWRGDTPICRNHVLNQHRHDAEEIHEQIVRAEDTPRRSGATCSCNAH